MLLELRHVGHHRKRGSRIEQLLRGVTLEVEQGEFVAVLGADGAQRTALTHVCAGLEPVLVGTARFDGKPLTAAVLGKPDGIALVHSTWSTGAGNVAGQVALPAMLHAPSVAAAHALAHETLERVGAEHLALSEPEDLMRDELGRVALARALMTKPRLLIMDTPTEGLTAGESDRMLNLLQSLVSHDRLGVLITAGEPIGLTGRVDRTLRMHRGELHGAVAPRPATVHELHPRRADFA